MADEKIEIDIEINNRQANAALKQTENQTKKTTLSAKKLGAAFKTGALVVVAAIGAMIAISKKAVDAYRVQELAVNELNNALKTQGIFTKKLSQEYQDNASELQNMTTFGDEAIISSQARLQAYLGEQKITKGLTLSILNFAQANKTDLATAADLVGKSIGSSTNALARYGIEIDSSATKAEKAATLQEALDKRYAGAAAAAAQGAGALIQFGNKAGDLAEVIGKLLLPVVAKIVSGLSSMTDFLIDLATAANDALTTDNVKQVAEYDAQLIKLKNTIAVLEDSLEGLEDGGVSAFGNEEQIQRIIDLRILDIQAILDKKAAIEDVEATEVAIGQKKIIRTKAELLAEKKKQSQLLIGQLKFQKGQVDIASATANLITAVSKDGSMAAFLAQKAAAIAQSIISTRLGVASALSNVLTVALAPAIEVAGNVNTAAIIATTVKGFNQGGLVTGKGGVDQIPALLSAGEIVVPKNNFDDLIRNFGGSIDGDTGTGGQQNVAVTVDFGDNFKDTFGDAVVSVINEREAIGTR